MFWTTRIDAIGSMALPNGQMLKLHGMKRARIVCQQGLLLITAYGVAADVELHDRATFVIPNHGLTLIEAVLDSHIQIVLPMPAAFIQCVATAIVCNLRRLLLSKPAPQNGAATSVARYGEKYGSGPNVALLRKRGILSLVRTGK